MMNRDCGSSRRPFTITNVYRDQEGCWHARLTMNGQTYAVDRKFGAWRFTPPDECKYRELPYLYAVALQAKVRKIEKRNVNF